MTNFATPLQMRGRGTFFTLGLSLFLLLVETPNAVGALVDLEAPAYRNRGYQAQQRGQWTVALKYYQKAVALDPYYATPYNDLGIVYEKQGEFGKAEGAYLKAISVDPRYLDAYANLALLYERTGKIEKAVDYWEKRVAYGHPNDPWTRKAMERLSLLEKGEVSVSYPVSPAQKIPTRRTTFIGEEPWAGLPYPEKSFTAPEAPSEYEEYGAVPAELQYIIGPSDKLRIAVWRHSDLDMTVTVRSDGRISYPLVDDLYVSGLTPQQLDDELTGRLAATLRNPQVTVIIEEFNSKAVYVLGEVKKPGRYLLMRPQTATEILAQAGQWQDSAVLTSVMVVRRSWTKSPKVYRLNLMKVVKRGDASGDMVLQDGDVVFVPRNFVKKLDNFLSFFSKHVFVRFSSVQVD
ncbi:MAG: polysaccharide biosynthesis/export family protein [Candidatus Omnitrophota bacterium]